MGTFYLFVVACWFIANVLFWLCFFLYAEKETMVEKLTFKNAYGDSSMVPGILIIIVTVLIAPWIWPLTLTFLFCFVSFKTMRRIVQWIKHRKDGKISPKTD